MPGATRANQYFLRLPHPINDEIVGLCVCVNAFLDCFHTDQVFAEVLKSLLTKFLVLVVGSVLGRVGVLRLLKTVLGEFYAKALCGVTGDAVEKLIELAIMSK